MKPHFGIRCAKCGDRLFSHRGHDYKPCSCGSCFVDGGREYFRWGYEPSMDKPPTIITWEEELDGNQTPTVCH